MSNNNDNKMKYPIRISNLFDEKIEILHNLKRKQQKKNREREILLLCLSYRFQYNLEIFFKLLIFFSYLI